MTARVKHAPPTISQLLKVDGYPTIVAGSLLWHVSRWGSLFATVLLVTRAGVSPLHIQLVSALFFAPLLAGAPLSKLFDRLAPPRTVVLTMQIVTVVMQCLLFVAVLVDFTPPWATALFVAAMGLGNTVNMTSQRMLVHDHVGDELAHIALAVEPLLAGVGMMVGSAGAGVMLGWRGDPASFGSLILIGLACIVLTLRIPIETVEHDEDELPAFKTGMKELFAGHPTLPALLAVTIVMNLFVFGYLTLVPKMVEAFTVDPSLIGLLGAAAGMGQLVGGLVIAIWSVRRRSLLLFAGSTVAILGVLVFALSSSVAVSFIALFTAGVGQSGFSAMQSVMTVEVSDPAIRATALGTVTTAVGANPLGVVLIGAFSQGLGARGGVLLAALIGLALLGGVTLIWRSTLRHIH